MYGDISTHLHGHNGDNLDLDAVKLIETAPASRLHEPGEYSPHRLVVLPIGAVDYHHVLCQVLAQVLRFGLAMCRVSCIGGKGSDS